jgi:hypothetical protein
VSSDKFATDPRYHQVHERTIESDFLLIVLKSLMFQRPDLRFARMNGLRLFCVLIYTTG